MSPSINGHVNLDLKLLWILFYCRLHEEVLVTAGLDGIVGIFQILGTELLTLRLLQVQVTAFLFNVCLSFILVKANFYSADSNFSMSHVRASFLFNLCSAIGRSLNSWKFCWHWDSNADLRCQVQEVTWLIWLDNLSLNLRSLAANVVTAPYFCEII